MFRNISLSEFEGKIKRFSDSQLKSTISDLAGCCRGLIDDEYMKKLLRMEAKAQAELVRRGTQTKRDHDDYNAWRNKIGYQKKVF